MNNEQLTMFYPPRRSQNPPSRCLLPTGFTLVEILIVISIMALLAVGSFVYFKDFSARQYTNKAVGQVQSLLRLAQSNATSSTKCNTQGATSWSVVVDTTTIKLRCDPENYLYRTYTLENSEITTILYLGIPATFNYKAGSGALSMPACTSTDCKQATSITFTIKNLINNEEKTFKLSKGGAVNVQ